MLLIASVAHHAMAMQPPSHEQLERYRADGTLATRAAAAREVGNHLISPELVERRRGNAAVSLKKTAVAPKRLPSAGHLRVFALLVGFSDYPGHNPTREIDRRLFGIGACRVSIPTKVCTTITAVRLTVCSSSRG